MDILNVLPSIGETFSGWMTNLIQFLSNIGLNISATSGKILNIFIVIGLLWISAKTIEKPLKYLAIGLLVVLLVSILSSFIPIA